MQRNAVSFIEKPKLSKTKSLRPVFNKKKFEVQSPTADLKGRNKLNNNNNDQDEDSMGREDDLSRAISDEDSSEDGMPKTEDIRLPKIEEPSDELVNAVDKIDLNLENHSSHEEGGEDNGEDLPMIKVVPDDQLQQTNSH